MHSLYQHQVEPNGQLHVLADLPTVGKVVRVRDRAALKLDAGEEEILFVLQIR
jgi:hypothetical protein